ncbi:unnamed protein product [Candida verbasci]|uniref:Nuclear import protein MOG1 n=1 Tax=Candida verbasci TaxID=1227364 RepID=A0A9W4XNN0_9ASCO|nr:unnamed protein product [Candida verbasci]
MTELYGGTISITQLPSTFIDVSKIRQVPDNQEVFINQNPTENANLDKSLIFDILEKLDNDYSEAIVEHLSDIYPNSESSKLIEKLESDDGSERFISFLKFKPEYTKIEPNQPLEIVSLIGLVRLDKVDTDILVQYNVPHDRDVETYNEEDYRLFKEIIESFNIVDWNLFG